MSADDCSLLPPPNGSSMAITVPGRMRYSRHKRSGISYGCHNESPGLLLAAISDLASLQVIPSVGFTPQLE